MSTWSRKNLIISFSVFLTLCIPLLLYTGLSTPTILPALKSALHSQVDQHHLGSIAGDGTLACTAEEWEEVKRFRKFQAGFPGLRGIEESGFPVGQDGEDSSGMGFDWPGMRTMFAFYKLASRRQHTLRLWTKGLLDSFRIQDQGVGDGRPETLWHLDHRLTDRTWADWLWAMFKNTRTTRYWNLARAGATISHEILAPGKEEWGTFQDQIDDFEEFFGTASTSGITWDPNTTIFLIYFGVNDISQLDRMNEGDMPIEETCAKFAQALFEISQRLIDLGAKHLLYLNAHPFHRSPKYVLPHIYHDIQPRVEQSVAWFNQYFLSEIAAFRARNSAVEQGEGDDLGQAGGGVNVMDFDLNRFLGIVLDYPEMFGLTDTQRFEMRWAGQGEDVETEYGQMGFAFRDFQHLSWNVHHQNVEWTVASAFNLISAVQLDRVWDSRLTPAPYRTMIHEECQYDRVDTEGSVSYMSEIEEKISEV